MDKIRVIGGILNEQEEKAVTVALLFYEFNQNDE